MGAAKGHVGSDTAQWPSLGTSQFDTLIPHNDILASLQPSPQSTITHKCPKLNLSFHVLDLCPSNLQA